MNADDKVRSKWCIGTETQDVHQVTMLEPIASTCNDQCPWRTANHGRTVELYYDHEVPGIPMPEQFAFSEWKRADIWENDLRHGVHGFGGLCHVRLAGTECSERGAWNVVSRQCTGALVMQQRELIRHVQHGRSALTPEGAARVASDMLGLEVQARDLDRLDLGVLLSHAHPALLDDAIGCNAVAAPLSEHERAEWSRHETTVHEL